MREREELLRWPSDGEMLDLLIAAGYNSEQVHPDCYRGFGWKTFTEKLRAFALSSTDGDAQTSVNPGPYQVTRCDDGAWMIHTEGDIIAYAGQGNEERKARAICAAMNGASAQTVPSREALRTAIQAAWDQSRDGFEIETITDAALSLVSSTDGDAQAVANPDAMREALEPFAAVANFISAKSPGDHQLLPQYGLTIKHFRAALAALSSVSSTDGDAQAPVIDALKFADNLLAEFGNLYGSSESPMGREVIGAVDRAKSKIRTALSSLPSTDQATASSPTPD